MTFQPLRHRRHSDRGFVSFALYRSNGGKSRRLHCTLGRDVARLLGVEPGGRVRALVGDPGTVHEGLLLMVAARPDEDGVVAWARSGSEENGALQLDLAGGWTHCRELHPSERCRWTWDEARHELCVVLPKWARQRQASVLY